MSLNRSRIPPPVRGGPSRRGVLRGGAMALTGAMGATGAAVAGCGTGLGVDSHGVVHIEVWHGQTSTALRTVKRLVADFHRGHPAIRIDLSGGVLADDMLQKVMTGLVAGSPPDVAYVFGSDLASVARSPQLADLTSVVESGQVPWKQYWPAAREGVTVDGVVRAVPAVLDSLAVVCNKALFRRAGLELPEPGWTWRDFTETARKLTDRGRGAFGTGWPAAGDEDTVWRMWPMVWDLGGEVIAEGKREVGFAGEPGVRSLEVLAALAGDSSVYVDPKPGGEQMYQAFAAGRLGMVATGPWQLPDIRQAKIDYQVVPLPGFRGGRSVTISGPDTWSVFDNGSARLKAARTFVGWLMEPGQAYRWDTQAGSLPQSRPAERRPRWRAYAAGVPGLQVFTEVLETARVRPVDRAYPKISMPFGEAITAVLLGRSTPAKALRRCADEANAAMAKVR
ncbi:ABC transporter substrate-binding protein [Streptomyces antioxidans]|uniref:ABC transporter substrate-binding protein n=1 Tax=Streptomyces antioxidans TaxID=1507734 RepID=A0A1V4CW76_9ACTN|nr:ABC transporter substrate-binding protein [Streptomyces antioxidans]OPF71653.1 ABC transporter substrate-binding protein [Streptomyces antioxidans]